jgi:streptogramin lyase
MKLSSFLKTTSQMLLIFSTLAACQARAATPLSAPYGLALDAKGNLYVTNLGTNQILVYNPSYVQQPKKTITAGLSVPLALAFDSKGNFYVANRHSDSVTVYDSTGKQKTGSTLTFGVFGPTGIAIDSLDDVWMANNNNNVTMYSTFGTLIGASYPGIAVGAIATHGAWYVAGYSDHWSQYPTGEVLTNRGIAGSGTFVSSSPVIAATFDNKGNYWVCNDTGAVWVSNPNTFYANEVIPAGSGPIHWGMAVDATRNRIYLSSETTNSIDVYMTSGAYINTIF